MNSTHTPPFAMTTESVSNWLTQIGKLDTIPASHELYSALKKLNRIELESEDLASILNQLTPSVLHLSGNLNALLLSAINSHGAINGKSRKLARLSGQLIRNHCLAYCHAIANQELDKTQKTQALFTALQLIGFSLKTHTLTSEKPSATLWKKMGELYQLANEEALINTPVTNKIPLFKSQKTIASVLKRNLLYALFDLYRPPADQLPKYYAIADRCAEHLTFTENPNASFNFYWDTTGCRFPQRGRPLNSDGANLVFNTAAVAQYLQSQMPASDRKDPFFNPVWQKLTGYWEIIDSVVPTKPMLYHLEIGLTSSIERLRHCNRLSNIQRLSAQLPEPIALRGIELVPLEHEKQGYQARWEEALQQHINKLKAGMAYLLPAKNPLFFQTQIKSGPLPDNLPVLLYAEQEAPRFGIIRFTQLNSETQNQTALIEILPGRLSPLNVKVQSLTTGAILIKHSSNTEGLILAPGKYTTGDTISRSDRPDSVFHLSRLIEANDHFRYYQLAAD